MLQHFRCHGTTFYNAALLGYISPQYSNATCCTVRLCNGTNNLMVSDFFPLDIFSYGLSRYRQLLCINDSDFVQLMEYSLHSAGIVQIMHMRSAGRCQVT